MCERWSRVRRDLQEGSERPLPDGVLLADLDPEALRRDIHSYGHARDVWEEIMSAAISQSERQAWQTDDLQEFGMDNFLARHVLNHKSLACGLSEVIGGKLSAHSLGGDVDYRAVLLSAFKADPDIVDAVACDMKRTARPMRRLNPPRSHAWRGR